MMQCSSRKSFDLTESVTSDYKFSKPFKKNLAVAQSQVLEDQFNELLSSTCCEACEEI